MLPSDSLVEGMPIPRTAFCCGGLRIKYTISFLIHYLVIPFLFVGYSDYQSLTSLDPAISDAYQQPTHTKEMDGC